MKHFSLQAEVDKQADMYRAHVVLWDGSLLERFANTEPAAAAALGFALQQAIKDAGFDPNVQLQAIIPLSEKDS